jgi:hypothetical protein
MNFLKLGLIAASMAVLAACGNGGGNAGGGGNGVVSPADKYVGAWDSACDTSNERVFLTFTKQSDTVLAYTSSAKHYASPNCTGSTTPVSSDVSLIFTLVGTKTLGADIVDKVILASGVNPEEKNLIQLANNQLQFGDAALDLDAEGFPNRLDTTIFFIKR